jgi:ABC-2 type transport system ATP-binding protein
MLNLENITFRYRKKTVFKDFSLTVGNGRVCGLLGKNGAGKSTLLYLMTGLLHPQKGKVMFNNADVSRRLPSMLSDVFLVPEEFTLPAVPLKEYVSLNKNFYPRFSEEQLKQNLSHFEMDADLKANLGALSLGQKKKVFMSFALAANTTLLLMDEPTNGLDIPGKSQFRRFIASNMNDERTVLISTHQVQDIEKLVEHVIILDNSELLLDATVEDICSKLAFISDAPEDNFENALFVAPSVQGFSAILPNDGAEESNLSLELLFNATLSRRNEVKCLFNNLNNTKL